MSRDRRHTTVAMLVEGSLGGLLVLAGLALAFLNSGWTIAFWLVTVGAAGTGHAASPGALAYGSGRSSGGWK